MYQKSSSSLSRVPQKKAWRIGQKDTFELWDRQKSVCTKLPTGYGKTFVIDESYRILSERNKVDRMLIVLPTVSQKNQYKEEHPRAWDIGFDQVEADKRHRNNKNDVFVITIHQLIQPMTLTTVNRMLSNCNWFIAIDEYHHYGDEKSWGITALGLHYTYRLCLSATPYRSNKDDVFGEPDIDVSYLQAVDEGCVKKLIGHSYVYVVEMIDDDGKVHTYTTDEISDKFGEGDKFEREQLARRMRWSPKYISPLISKPIDRMALKRLEHGVKLQCLVFALSVSHAKLVASQISSMYPEYNVEWVGQSEKADCKTDAEDSDIIRRFKNNDGIDILVNYQKAGEGIDSIYVSEVVFLKNVRLNISTLQNIGRASRKIGDIDVIGYVNFDSTCELSQSNYTGESIMKALEFKEASEPGTGSQHEESSYESLPEEPAINILNMYLVNVDEGERINMINVMDKLDILKSDGVKAEELLSNPDHPYNEKVENLYRQMRATEAERINEESVITQWRDVINNGMIHLTTLVIPIWRKSREEKSERGDVKKFLNKRKSMDVGKISNDIDTCRAHYNWIRKAEKFILESNRLPWE